MLDRAKNFWKRLPLALKGVAIVLLLVALYIPILELMEAREEARLVNLSHAQPGRYLDTVRNRQGMRSYLEALAEIRHFGDWKQTAPTFLIGAWALRKPETGQQTGTAAHHCLSGIVIEDGRIRYFGENPHFVKAEYRIDEYDRILAREDDGQTLAITVPRHGRGEHMIEVEMPGRDQPRYGFRCE